MQIGFYFSSSSGYPCGTSVAPGWYIDEVRLLHDFALLIGSTITPTQSTACVTLAIAQAVPAATVSFALWHEPGYLGNFELNPTETWINPVVVPGPNSEVSISFQNSATTAQMGIRNVGTICFSTAASESAFVPMIIRRPDVVNQDASHPVVRIFNGRTVVVGDKALLESWLNSDQRMATLYGPAGRTYETSHTFSLNDSPWVPGWTNTIPASLFETWQLDGPLSNAPAVYLRALER